MPANTLLYPPDYTFGTSGTNAVGATQSLTIESAINSIQVSARDTALKGTHTRRIAGQNSIDLQNRLISAFPGVMPLFQVTTVSSVVAPFLGSQAILGGGRGHDPGKAYANMYRFTYSGETYVPINIALSSARFYMGTVSDSASGKFCSGSGLNVNTSAVIDKVSYAEMRSARIAATLSNIDLAPAGGLGTKTFGYLVGGVWQGRYIRSISRYSHALDTVTYLGETAATFRMAPHNGAGNRFNGYTFGGGGLAVGSGTPNVFDWFAAATSLTNADRLVYATEVSSVVGITMDHQHTAHAMMGYETKCYVAGGGPANIASPFSSSIYGFTFSGETGAVLAATLGDPKVCVDGISSQAAGYAVGGDTAGTGWIGSTSIDRLTFATETCARIGARIDAPFADQGAISDYSPGFSY